jgi:basic membrane lipoprotein Med (substrate-binding protein (PBP1-ABC) superfamily)
MKMSKKIRLFLGLLLLASLVLSACAAPAAPVPVQEPAAVEMAAEPTELKIAIISTTPKEEPWNTVLLQAVERVIAEKPHGLTISYTFQELISTPDGERVMRELASSGEYDIIWGHSVYPDAIQALGPKYPDIPFVGGGSGYEPMGQNMYWVNMYVHEAAYLNGIIAGKMTKTNVIGAVAAFPYENVNMPINAYFEGAKSVNPNVKVKMSYIESWYDPPKAKEEALAQIAAGADFIYAERFGPFEAASEKGVYAFGHYMDQNELAPDTVVSSALALWDPCVKAIVDAWWDHTTKGTPYNASTTDAMYFFMKDGATDISEYHGFENTIPEDVKALVEQKREEIKSGKLAVPANGAQAVSDQ